MRTKKDKRAAWLRAELVEDSPNTITLFLGHGIKPINFRRGTHDNFLPALRIIEKGDPAEPGGESHE